MPQSIGTDKVSQLQALVERVEQVRRDAAVGSSAAGRESLGQFFTPSVVASFLAGMFGRTREHLRLLDAGAGIGALTVAFIAEMCQRSTKPRRIHVAAYEKDPRLEVALRDTLKRAAEAAAQFSVEVTFDVTMGDFIDLITRELADGFFDSHSVHRRFDYAIMNPPYRKIRGDSTERIHLRRIGIETSNLYAGFIALASRVLAADGEMVAITPRSFCNGPYFRAFRRNLIEQMRFRRLHVFESRADAFAEDNVLQENVVLHLVKNIGVDRVVVSQSRDATDENVVSRTVPHDEIADPRDPSSTFHIVTRRDDARVRQWFRALPSTLEELGIAVSTGRVVDFRAVQYLRSEPEDGTVPLLYPCHLRGGTVSWPVVGGKKANAIERVSETEDLLVPSQYYVLVKRFSSKEERRRISACVFFPQDINSEVVAFENHLNYFYSLRRPLGRFVAIGLAAFLNSRLLDQYFRTFSGHTQVNATDLRSLRYPNLEQLAAIGRLVQIGDSRCELGDEPLMECVAVNAD